jgi:hypothetical protein
MRIFEDGNSWGLFREPRFQLMETGEQGLQELVMVAASLEPSAEMTNNTGRRTT